MSDEELELNDFAYVGKKEDNDEEDLDITAMMVVFTCIFIIYAHLLLLMFAFFIGFIMLLTVAYINICQLIE